MEDDEFSDYDPSCAWEEIGTIVRIERRPAKTAGAPRPVFRAIPVLQGDTF
jgi:hypothetical protein